MSHALLAGEIPPADKLNALGESGSYTPQLTAVSINPDLGDEPTQRGAWWRNGHLITAFIYIEFDVNSNAGSGEYRVSVPFDIDVSAHPILAGDVKDRETLGFVYLKVGSSLETAVGVAAAADSSNVGMVAPGANPLVVDEAYPAGWGNQDSISMQLTYIADPAGLP